MKKYYNTKTLNTTANLYACFRSSVALNGFRIALVPDAYTASYYRQVINKDDHATVLQLLSKNVHPLAIMFIQ